MMLIPDTATSGRCFIIEFHTSIILEAANYSIDHAHGGVEVGETLGYFWERFQIKYFRGAVRLCILPWGDLALHTCSPVIMALALD
jgi:hypothetical protein